MYIIQPKDIVDAVDAATGDLIWTYKRNYPEGFKGATIKRNAAVFENLLIGSSSDGFVYALDIATGKLVWETKITDWKTQNANPSGGPIIANGKVISGRNCQPDAGPEACVFVAVDARTGKELWRLRTTPRPGEPGRRDVGRGAGQQAHSGRHMDAADLRSRAQSRLLRHVRDVADAQVHPGRQ